MKKTLITIAILALAVSAIAAVLVDTIVVVTPDISVTVRDTRNFDRCKVRMTDTGQVAVDFKDPSGTITSSAIGPSGFAR
jgi:ABC-type amino acid transport substrate-binding protein